MSGVEFEGVPTPHRRRVTGGAAHAARVGAPSHLIVFPEVSDRNASQVASILRVREQPRSGAHSTLQMVSARGDHRPAARVFQRVGIAAGNLTPAEQERFRRIDGVQVIENRTRRIPPIIEASAAATLAKATGIESNAISYLAGLRDGIDLAVSGLSGVAPVAMPGAPAIRAPDATSWCLRAIGIEPSRSLKGKGIKVAVLDTGIDATHRDLAGRIKDSQSFVAGEGVLDEHGHGTHCAGIVAGPVQSTGPTAYGIASEADLLIAKVLDRSGYGTDDQIIEAMTWAADHGARIISMSLGSDRRPEEGFSVAYETVASTLLKEGVLIVAAAGNESSRPGYTRPVGNPAACPSILAVAAVDRALRVAYFSSRRMDDIGSVDLAAPGVDVYSAWTQGGFRVISGTSMATPHVAGVAALLAEKGGKEAAGQTLWQQLTSTARPLVGEPNDIGAGLVFAP